MTSAASTEPVLGDSAADAPASSDAPAPEAKAKRLAFATESPARSPSAGAAAGWARLRREVFRGRDPHASFQAVTLRALQELRRQRAERTKHTSTWQSINYAGIDNAVLREELRGYGEADRDREKLKAFFIALLVGLCSGTTAVLLLKAIETVLTLRTKLFMSLWQRSDGLAWLALALPTTALFVASISIVMFKVPPAAGSGIPEVKAYLNGVLLPQAWSPRVFVAKVLSCWLACSTGLPVGPEGPIIYLGGNIGHFMTSRRILKCVRLRYTNKLQRTTITTGVSAGVAAAFAAPIGALLFTVEEVSSIFTSDILWVGFICSFASYFVTILLPRVLGYGPPTFSTAGIFSGGHIRQWQLEEIPGFLVLGLVMGVLGALFNIINVRIVNERWRGKVIKKTRPRQLLEVIVIALALSSVWLFLPKLVPCVSIDVGFPEGSRSEESLRDLREAAKGLWCEHPETEYNPLATLFFGSLDDVVKYLYMSSDGVSTPPFSMSVLVTYSAAFFVAALYIAGCSMATGLFIPMIVIGAAVGRFYGQGLQILFPKMALDTAAYAVCGSAGFIGGVTRISVAMTVIMLELSNDLSLLLPILLVTGIAKFVGDRLTHPLYDMILEMRHIPFLEPEPAVAMERLRCYQVMQRPVVCLPVEVTVLTLCKTLCNCAHNGFPVVSSLEPGVEGGMKLQGIISRAHLEVILKDLDYFLSDPSSSELATNEKAKQLSNHYLATKKVLRGHADNVFEDLTDAQLRANLDLHRWMNRAPISIKQINAVGTAFQLMRSFGLRQLPVVDTENCLVGIVTRHDLFHVQHDPEHYHQQAQQRHHDFSQIRARLRTQSSHSLDSGERRDSRSPLLEGEAAPAVGRRASVTAPPTAEELDDMQDSSPLNCGTFRGPRRSLLERVFKEESWVDLTEDGEEPSLRNDVTSG